MAVTSVPDLSSLVSDYTIDPTGGTAGTSVPTSFTLQTTLPLRINGGASADLSTSPNVFTANTFGTGTSGIVPGSAGDTTHYLRADGSWSVPPGTGGGYTTISEQGASLTQRAQLNFVGVDITASDNSGTSSTDVTLNRFTSITGGTVPASGGSVSSFLCADGTWKTTASVSGQVSLQGSTPGTADVGNDHITGTSLTDTAIGVGTNSPYSGAKVHTVDTTGSRPFSFLAQGNGTGVNPSVWCRASRGTEGAPTSTKNNDTLGTFFASGYNTTSGYFGSVSSGLTVYADGDATATTQPTYMDARAGNTGSSTIVRVSSAGALVKPASLISSSDRALSTLDVSGSVGFGTTPKTASFTAGSNVFYPCDATGGQIVVTLPNANTCAGRIYVFAKTDSTLSTVRLVPTGCSVSGTAVYELFAPKGAVVVESDGSNYWTHGYTRTVQHTIYQNPTGDTIANVTGPQAFTSSFGLNTDRIYEKGGTFRLHWSGNASCTGTPNLTLQVYWVSGVANPMVDGKAYTMPSGISSGRWRVDATLKIDTSGNIDGSDGLFYMPVSTNPYVTTPLIGTLGGTTFSGTGSIGLYVTWSAPSASNTISVSSARMDYFPPGIVL